MNKKIEILQDKLETCFYDFVRKSARYIGGEVNQIKKDLADCQLTVGLCFPDIYEVAMSNSGLAIIYNVLNNLDNAAAERVFAPWLDAEEIMRKNNIPLFSLESKAAVRDFDIIGFSLSTELCYSNVLNMIDLAGLKIRSKDRKESDPIIIAGGAMAKCCEPIADFIDCFILGDGEEAAAELAKLVMDQKAKNSSKQEILKQIDAAFEWAYVPQFYDFKYDNKKIIAIEPSRKFKDAIVKDFENAMAIEKPIVPFVEAVHERITVEIMRGCPGRCRFCQASYTKRPLRYRSVERIMEIAKKSYEASGFDTVSLLSLSTADYPDLERLLENVYGYFSSKKVGVSLPSLRVDQQLKILPKFVNEVRKAGLTIAVEAASEKLRRLINKPITNENLFAAVEEAYIAGWQKIKFYFMVGFPGETEQDIIGIVDLCSELGKLGKKITGKFPQLNIAISWLVPKPHTPFGWLGQKSRQYFEDAKQLIIQRKLQLHAKSLQFKFHTINQSILEAALGRGDRRLSAVIESAWRKGGKFDLWDECFNYQIWAEAFEENGLSLDDYAQKQFNHNDILPWQHLGKDLPYFDIDQHLNDE